ncbi:hypothetical protein [Sphaerisporangium perillae]|uniref:hypothetical protein n=1 Tax=Sphaerisporangium perillae TaxID=2935860 RepID=UPI00200FE30E|nr:hypothetical protein [Sphaerisporangium perillae]
MNEGDSNPHGSGFLLRLALGAESHCSRWAQAADYVDERIAGADDLSEWDLRTMPNAADVTTPQTKAARKVLSGYRERLALTKDPAARTRKADAAVADALREMVATLDRSTLAGKRDAVALLLGYACAARVSELVALDIADVRETPEGLLVTIYRRKIKKFTETAVPPSDQAPTTRLDLEPRVLFAPTTT